MMNKVRESWTRERHTAMILSLEETKERETESDRE
jgi:hypothetical protein